MATAMAVDVEGSFDRLRSAISEIAAEDIDASTDAALGEDLVAMRRSIDLLEAEFARRARRFEHLKGYLSDGAASVVSWIRYRCRLSSAGASQRVEIARRLDDMPGATAAFRHGAISYAHAAALARTASEVGSEAARQVARSLLRYARRLDPDRLRIVCRHVRHCVDPDGALRDAERDHERRYLHLSQTFDGVYVIDGLLDAEGGALLSTTIDSLTMPMPRDGRSAAQRRADALVELARRQAAGGTLPSRGGRRPHLTVTVPIDTLQRKPGSGGAATSTRDCLPADTARRIACDAVMTVVGIDKHGEPLSVGRTRRTVPAPMRRALEARDGGCRAEGCDRPIEWTDAHHNIVHWVDGGSTEVSNLLLLCRVHHRMVHEGRQTIRLRPVGPDARAP